VQLFWRVFVAGFKSVKLLILLGFWSEVSFMNVEYNQVKFTCNEEGEKVQMCGFRLILLL